MTHPTRFLVNLSLKEAADFLAEVAVVARRQRLEKSAALNDYLPDMTKLKDHLPDKATIKKYLPEPTPLNAGLLGAGLGAGLGGLTGYMGGSDTDPKAKRRRGWHGAISGLLAGGALGGGLGLARSVGSPSSSSDGGATGGLPKGHFKDPRTGKLMAIDKQALRDNPDLINEVHNLTGQSVSSRIGDAVGAGVGSAAYYAPASTLTALGLSAREIKDRMSIYRNPENFVAAMNAKDAAKFLGSEATSAMNSLKEELPKAQDKVFRNAAGSSLTQRWHGAQQAPSFLDKLKRLFGKSNPNSVVYADKAGNGLVREEVRRLMRQGYNARMGGLPGFVGRAALPLLLAGGADLGFNYLRGNMQDFNNERKLQKLMSQYAKPAE